MHAFLPLAVLGLAATGAVANTPNSYSAWVQEYPSCGQSCLKHSFNAYIAPSCGAHAFDSSDPQDLKCICNLKASGSQGASELSSEHSCIMNSCRNLNQTQKHTVDIIDVPDFFKMCAPYNKLDSALAHASPSAWPSIILSSATSSASAAAGTYASFPYTSTLVMGGVVGGMSMLGMLLVF